MTSTDSHAIRMAADRLAAAEAAHIPCAPIRDLIGPDDIDTAYRVQTHNLTRAIEAGKRVVGRKIGLTSPAVQRQMGVRQPDFGVLLDDMDCSGAGVVDFGRLIQPRVEAEIAMRVSCDVTEIITAESAPGYVSAVYAALEIVDSRIVNWDISVADTVADNASSGVYVLGDSTPVADVPDLADVSMTLTADGVAVSTGVGADCLGSPWEAMAWLANTSLSYGAPLRAGEVILSGALGAMVPAAPGTAFASSISGVGAVTVTFTQSIPMNDDKEEE